MGRRKRLSFICLLELSAAAFSHAPGRHAAAVAFTYGPACFPRPVRGYRLLLRRRDLAFGFCARPRAHHYGSSRRAFLARPPDARSVINADFMRALPAAAERRDISLITFYAAMSEYRFFVVIAVIRNAQRQVRFRSLQCLRITDIEESRPPAAICASLLIFGVCDMPPARWLA